jgi:hypothetical protein
LTLQGVLTCLLLVWMRTPSANGWLEGSLHSGCSSWRFRWRPCLRLPGPPIKAYSDRDWLDGAGSLFLRIAQNTRSINVLVAGFFLSFLLSITVFSGIPQEPLPRFLYLFEIALARSAPLLIWLCLAALQLIGLVYLGVPMVRTYLVKTVLVGALLSVLFVFYWLGGVRQLVEAMTARRPTNPHTLNMLAGCTKQDTPIPAISTGCQCSLYPIATLFARYVRAGVLPAGKVLELILSFLSGSAGLIFSRYFRPLHTLNLMLIITFLVFIFKTAFFQTEVLFYFLNFCLFWCLWRLLHRPSIPIAILTGLMAGLAHLTKASILPGLVLYLIFALLKGLWVLFRQRRAGQVAPARQPASIYFLVVPVVALVFLASVFPYIRTAKRITGHYFYNVNSTFYIWYDN